MSTKVLSINIGDVFTNNDGSSAIVIEYIRYSQVLVRFLDDNSCEKVFSGKDLKTGEFRNPYTRNVFGIGYLGHGPYSSRSNNGKDPAYRKWACMMARCYADRNIKCYEGVTVCDLWHNFQNFAEWFYSQKSFSLNWELDKDLINGSSKYYSPENCCLLPKKINRFLVGKRLVRSLPAGVTKDHGKDNGVYLAKSYKIDGTAESLGKFFSVEDAFLAYANHKKNTILELAEFYKEDLCEKAYSGLLTFKVRRD